MVMYRGLADDLALMDWLQQYIFPAEAKTVAPAFVRAGTRAGRARDDPLGHHDLHRHVLLRGGDRARHQGGGPARRARRDGHRVPCRPTPRRPPTRSRARSAFIQEFQDDPLITPAVAPHSMYTARQGRPARVPRARDEVSEAAAHPPRRDRGRDQDVARAPPRDADRLPRADRPLGPDDRRRARRVGHRRRTSRCSRSATSACRTTPRAT